MQLANMSVWNGQPTFVIAWPCVIGSESMIMNTVQTLKKVGQELGIGRSFKSLFDKANGSFIESYRRFAVHCLFVSTQSAEYKSNGLDLWPLALVSQLLALLQAIDATVKAPTCLDDLVN